MPLLLFAMLFPDMMLLCEEESKLEMPPSLLFVMLFPEMLLDEEESSARAIERNAFRLIDKALLCYGDFSP
jgi:hypothetical protein